jgi:hypothetical protein
LYDLIEFGVLSHAIVHRVKAKPRQLGTTFVHGLSKPFDAALLIPEDREDFSDITW